jgi:hypothetical protein
MYRCVVHQVHVIVASHLVVCLHIKLCFQRQLVGIFLFIVLVTFYVMKEWDDVHSFKRRPDSLVPVKTKVIIAIGSKCILLQDNTLSPLSIRLFSWGCFEVFQRNAQHQQLQNYWPGYKSRMCGPPLLIWTLSTGRPSAE